MSILSNDAPFATTPVAAAAAGSNARTESTGLVHGTAPKRDSIKLEDAARLIRETAEKLWRGSMAAIDGLMRLLLNFFRWITRPFRDNPDEKSQTSGQANGADFPANGQRQGAGIPEDVNRFADGPARIRPVGDPGDGRLAETTAAPTAKAFSDADPVNAEDFVQLDGDERVPVNSGALIPDDYLGQEAESEEGDALASPLTKKVGKLAFPAGYTGNKLAGELPISADTIVGTMERLKEKVPNLDAIDANTVRSLMISTLEQYVSQATQARAKVQELDAQIKTQLVTLAATGDTPADQLLGKVLASKDFGGLAGAEIRRLQAARDERERVAADRQRDIESSLLSARQQGLDVAEIAAVAKVDEALPEWREWIARLVDQEPAAPTPAERCELALDVDPDPEIGPSEPSPERVASLKAALISNVSNNNEHEDESERPRG